MSNAALSKQVDFSLGNLGLKPTGPGGSKKIFLILYTGDICLHFSLKGT